MSIIKNNMTILFQGDSITDCDRNREDIYDLGNGYPKYVEKYLKEKHPECNLRLINKGVSGDRSVDLVKRWQKDCIDIKPDIISILIGINDTWRRYDENDITTADEFERNYRYLLTRIKETLNIPVILMEPFVLEVTPDRKWREDLDPKIHIVRRLAREFGCVLIPLDGIMAAESCQRKITELSEDGVHPVEEGKKLIARSWVEAVESVH